MDSLYRLCRQWCRQRWQPVVQSFCWWIRRPERPQARSRQRPHTPLAVAFIQILESRVCLSAVTPQLVVPPTVYSVVGEPTTVLFENLVPTLTTAGLRFEVICDIGVATGSAWTVTPQMADVGDHVWQISLWQGDTLVDSQSNVIRVSANAGSGRPYNLLLVGDSLTHYSIYPSELANQFAAEGRDVTLLGTHHPTDSAPNVFHEGYGGWTWNKFLTHYEPKPDPAVNKRSSPFVFLENGGATLNVSRYWQESLGGTKPDFVTFMLGINDCISLDASRPDQVNQQIDSVLTSAESLISAFRAALPETEIGICLTPPPNARESAFTQNYNGRYIRENWKPVQHRLVERMIDRFEARERDNVFVIPTGLNMSPEDSYAADNAVHPNQRGYGEIAATIRSWLLTRMQPQMPSFANATFVLNENSAVDNFVGRLVAQNTVSNRPPVFSITGGAGSKAFMIDAATGELRVANSAALDFETNPILEVTVTIRDPYLPDVSAEATVTVRLQDVNDAPTAVELQNLVSSLAEMTETSSRIKVADIAVADDSLGVNTLTLSGLDAAAFEISNRSLYLKGGTLLDFESKPRYVVTIEADDGSVGIASDARKTYVLDLLDINEPPPAIALTNRVITLPENANSAGRVKVAEIAITDYVPNDSSLELTGIDAANFEIANRELYLKATANLDFEVQEFLSVTVVYRDSSQSAVHHDAQFVLQLTNVNEAPTLDRGVTNLIVHDDATIAPFAGLTLSEPDTQDQFVRVTIINGTNRGDFTPRSTAGWTKIINGYDIVYERYFATRANIGAIVEPKIQGLMFQPRANVIPPTRTELCDLSLFVNDGLANTIATTRIATISRNDVPQINGVRTTATVSDNTVVNPFNMLTVTDHDYQEMLITMTILNGVHRGDFINASSSGWLGRRVLGNDIIYSQYFSPTADVGAAAQAAFRALTFQPRNNVLKPQTSELVDFQLTVSDGVAPAIANTKTRITTVSVNDYAEIQGASNAVTVSDDATVNPFSALTITDHDFQEMTISVTILNGVYRGDFTNAITSGWTPRQILGNDITYTRYFSPRDNVGSSAQAAFRALTFQPRSNAIAPGTTELTDFQVTVGDGVTAAFANRGTRVSTISMNEAPAISGANAAVIVNDNATVQPLTSLTVTDPDAQELLVSVTILNGVHRGDFVDAIESGWTVRYAVGNDIIYRRYFSPAKNAGARAQAAIQSLVFRPRSNMLEPGTSEMTDFQVAVNDGTAPAVFDRGTRVTTVSLNDASVIGAARANQNVVAGASVMPFMDLTVADPDTQDMLARVTITDGIDRGDFTTGSTVGWTRNVVGTNIIYSRYFHPTVRIGATVQAAIRALTFQSRANIPAGQIESFVFTIDLRDGTGGIISNNETSVVVT